MAQVKLAEGNPASPIGGAPSRWPEEFSSLQGSAVDRDDVRPRAPMPGYERGFGRVRRRIIPGMPAAGLGTGRPGPLLCSHSAPGAY